MKVRKHYWSSRKWRFHVVLSIEVRNKVERNKEQLDCMTHEKENFMLVPLEWPTKPRWPILTEFQQKVTVITNSLQK